MKFVRYVFHGSSSPCPGGGKRRFAFGIWAAIVAVAVVVGSGVVPALATTESVTYLKADGTTNTQENATVVEASTGTDAVAWNAGWYVVKSGTSDSPTEIKGAITVTGEVNLVLVDDAALTASGGITLDTSTAAASLTIWAGSKDKAASISGTGTLTVSAIKSSTTESNTTALTINGGNVSSTGGNGTTGEASSSAETAGGDGTAGTPGISVTTLTVNSGSVTGTGGNGGAGGNGANNETEGGAGSNGGKGGAGGDGITATNVNINGGEVTATGGNGANGGDGGKGGAAAQSGTAGNGGDAGSGGNSGNGITASEKITITNGTLTASAGTTVGNAGTKGEAGSQDSGSGGSAGNEGQNGTAGSDINGDVDLTYKDAYSVITIKATSITSDKKITATKKLVYHKDSEESATNLENDITSSLDDINDKELTPEHHTVVFYMDKDGDEEYKTLKLLTTETLTKPEDPTREGYTFVDWYTKEEIEKEESQTAYTFPSQALTQNLNLYAKWTLDNYTITLNLDSGSIADDNKEGWTADEDNDKATRKYTVEAEDDITIPDLTKVGYTFTGWTLNGQDPAGEPATNVTIPQGSTGDKEYTANFTANTYTITFDTGDADEDSTFDDSQSGYVYGANDAAINFPSDEKTLTRKGYTFVGWTASNAENAEATYTSSGTTKLTANDVASVEADADGKYTITLYAVWTANEYTITLNLNGGTWPTDEAYSATNGWNDGENSTKTKSYTVADDEITIPDLTRTDGYNFGGWTGTSLTEATKGLTITPEDEAQNLTFTATWHKKGAFTPAASGEDNYDKPEVAYHSMVLGGKISVMFYVYFPKDNDDTGNEFTHSNSSVTFTVKGKSEIYHEGVTNGTSISDGTYTLYPYQCYLSSVEMADSITATLVRENSDGSTGTYTLQENYSALTYLTALTGDEVQADTSKALGRAIMNYGHYVQPILAQENSWIVGTEHTTMTNASDYTDAYIELVKTSADEFGVSITTSENEATTLDAANLGGLHFSLLLSDDTTIRLYMKPKEAGTAITVTTPDNVTHNELSASKKEINGEDAGVYSYVDIESIPAHELGETKTVTITAGGATCKVSLSALSYVRAVLNSDTYKDDADMKNAMAALYDYYAATIKYRDNTEQYPEYVGATDSNN